MTLLPDRAEIEAASARLREVVVRTPLVPLHGHEGAPILLKPEIHQVVGSFKIRGVLSAVLAAPAERRARGLATVSAGNTAQALGWCARRLGHRARSLMPSTAPAAKIDAVSALGVEPVLLPPDELFAYLREERWRREEGVFVHPWIDPHLVAGHASLGLEIAADLPGEATIYVPVGGGGLIAGIAAAREALGAPWTLVAVEPAGCAALHESLRAGRPTGVDCRTVCDGVAVPYVTRQLFEIAGRSVARTLLVSDERVLDTVRRLALSDRMVVEPSGALALAAALDDVGRGAGPAVALVTGGSVDPALLVRLLEEDGSR